MKVSHYLHTKPIEEVPGAVMRKVICEDAGAPNFCMRVFEVAPGYSTPSHFHPWEHEVFVLSGEGVVRSKDGEKKITKDMVVFIAPNEKHCFVNNGKEPLRFICVIPILPPGMQSKATECRFAPMKK